MNEKDFNEIFKNYEFVSLNRKGLTVTFDSPEHARDAFKGLTKVLEEQRLKEKEGSEEIKE